MVSGYKSYFQKKELLFALVLDLWEANVNYGYDMYFLTKTSNEKIYWDGSGNICNFL